MGSIQLKIRDDIVAGLEQKEGNSFSDKIEGLLKRDIKPNDSIEIDYDKIKGIVDKSVQDALVELQHGRL